MRRSAPAEVLIEETDPEPVASVVPFFGDGQRVPHRVFPTSLEIAPELRAEIARVFGSEILADHEKMEAVAVAAREFRHSGRKLLSAAVDMGRTLIVLEQKIGMAALVRGMRESKVIFCGWSAGNLSKMMKVAMFVDGGLFPLETLPQNWSTTYELATLSVPELDQARRGDLVRPDVTRTQIQEFKKRLPEQSRPEVELADNREALRTQIRAMQQRKRRLERQLKDVVFELRNAETKYATLDARPTSR